MYTTRNASHMPWLGGTTARLLLAFACCLLLLIARLHPRAMLHADADGPTITGYLDANVRVLYRGHCCEIQILVVGFDQLKGEQTPLYNLARQIGLVGPLPPEYAATDATSASQVKIPFKVWGDLAAARMTPGGWAIGTWAFGYCLLADNDVGRYVERLCRCKLPHACMPMCHS